jgi:PAS domain S-box-containing protein
VARSVIAEVEQFEAALRRLNVVEGAGDAITALLHDITSNLPDAISVKDTQGRWLFANPAALEATGKSAEQVLGRRDGEIFEDAGVAAAIAESDRRIMEAGEAVAVEEHVATPCGLRWFLSTKAPVRDGAGRVTGLIGVARDITERKRAEQALRASEERFRAFVMASSDVVYRMSPDWSEMRELRGREFIADTDAPSHGWLAKYIDPEDRPHVMATIHEAIRTKGVFQLEHRVVRVDGTLGWTLSRAIPILDANGDIVEWFGAASDITARKSAEEALRESEARLRLAQQAARAGSFEWDIQSGVNTWTPELEALHGLPFGGFGGTEAIWESLVHPDDRAAAIRRVEEAFDSGEPTDGEWRVVWPDGSVHWLTARFQVFRDRDGKPSRMTGINIDVTERKRSEELRASEAALREADRHKDQFLAMLSHELRNPLAPIRNSLYILDRAAPGGEQARRAQAVLHRQIGQMTWLIDDLLDVTRIAHGKVQLLRERFDLNELAHRIAEDHRTVFLRGEVRLEVQPAPGEILIDGDRIRLGQVIGNLLQNAIKFTPRGGKATVSVEADPARGEATLTVRDTGVGIEPEVVPRLFRAFSQGDATLDRSKGGLGLGLALVRGLVELHGGSVSAASGGTGKGAAFTVRLPLDARPARMVAGPRALPGTGSPRRVLIIEDNGDAADTLREVLELEEHVVEVAYDGREGIRKARAFHPDVVLCDIGLPEMDGYEVARTMRADPELGRIALVAVSGYAQPEDVAMAREAGFDVHLAKPPSIEALERALAEVGGARLARPVPG